jgi:hypothetical protein
MKLTLFLVSSFLGCAMAVTEGGVSSETKALDRAARRQKIRGLQGGDGGDSGSGGDGTFVSFFFFSHRKL